MTAQLANDRDGGPIWFFTSSDTDLAKALGRPHRAVAHFAAKGDDLVRVDPWRARHGQRPDDDRSAVESGPWPLGSKVARRIPSCGCFGSMRSGRRSGSTRTTCLAGVRLLLARDPKKEYKDKIAEVELPE